MNLRKKLHNITNKIKSLRKLDNLYPCGLIKGSIYRVKEYGVTEQNLRYIGIKHGSSFGNITYEFSGVITKQIEHYKDCSYGYEWVVLEKRNDLN